MRIQKHIIATGEHGVGNVMKSIKRLVLSSLTALSVVGGGAVSAEPVSDCSCDAGLISNVAAKGSLVNVSGDVFVSGPSGFTEAKPGQTLELNSRVIVGPKGSVHLRYGQCRITAPADSTAMITTKQSNVCVNVTRSFEGVAEQQTAGFAGLDSTVLTPLFVGVGSMGLGFVGLGVAIADAAKASD